MPIVPAAPLWQVSDAIAHMRQLLGALPDGSLLTAFLPTVGAAEPGRAALSRGVIQDAGCQPGIRTRWHVGAASGCAVDVDPVQHRDDHHCRLWVIRGLWLDRLMARDRIGSTGGLIAVNVLGR